MTFDEVGADGPPSPGSLLAGDVEIDWPGGERHRELVARVESAWAELRGHGGGRPIVVSHGGPIWRCCASFWVGPARRPILEPGSIVRLGRTGGDPWQPLPAVAATLGS